MVNEKEYYQMVFTNLDPNLGRDKIQEELTKLLIAYLFLRGNDSVNDTMIQFAKRYAGILRWLGSTEREDQIIMDAMKETEIDLSHWLEEK